MLITYFQNFGVEYFLKEIKKIIGNKNVETNIFRVQNYDLVMCGCFCTGGIDFMFKSKCSTNFNKFIFHNF